MSTIFSSFDIRGRLSDTLTPENAWNVGKAFADWLPNEGHITVLSDTAAEPKIVSALIEGVRLQGRAVIDGGHGSIERLIQIIADEPPAGSLYVSHDETQGLEVIQLYQNDGVALSSDNGLIELGELVDAGNFVPSATKGDLTQLS
ncbi:MAG: hypothetical protein WAS27_00130 [Candidatus Saccharimonadales bacterium]